MGGRIVTSTIDIADFMPYRLGCAWTCVQRAEGSTAYGYAIEHLNHERLRRTVGGVDAHPLKEKVLHAAENVIYQELPNRRPALRSILWAASTDCPADVIEAIDHVRALLEDCNP